MIWSLPTKIWVPLWGFIGDLANCCDNKHGKLAYFLQVEGSYVYRHGSFRGVCLQSVEWAA